MNISRLENLVDLRLHDNELRGDIPRAFREMTNLDSLWLYDNRFGGSFTCPDFITLCYISCGDFESFRDQCRKQ